MVDLVVAYYNEDLSWINNYNKFNKIFIYNKGNNKKVNLNIPFTEIKLPNVGKCDHTYIYHIVNNYSDLGNVTIFTTGSAFALPHKKQVFEIVFNKTFETNDTVLCGDKVNNMPDHIYNFQLDKWDSTLKENNSELSSNLELSKIRPLGKWHNLHFPNINMNIVTYYGIFSVSKKHIQQHDKEYYVKLLNDFPEHYNPEVGHYFERSWGSVFHPIPQNNLYNKDKDKDKHESFQNYSFDNTYIIILIIIVLLILTRYYKYIYKLSQYKMRNILKAFSSAFKI